MSCILHCVVICIIFTLINGVRISLADHERDHDTIQDLKLQVKK